jgi:hypothetical protein
MSQASALSLRLDQVPQFSELDVGAGDAPRAESAAADLLRTDGHTVVWLDPTTKYKDNGKHAPDHPDFPLPHDISQGGSKPFQVPDRGSTLVLLGLGLSLIGLFQQKPRRSLG